MQDRSKGMPFWQSTPLIALSLFATLFFLQLYTIRGPRGPLIVPGAGDQVICYYDESTLRRKEIISAFRFAWNGYFKFAFPHDELHPVANTPGFSRNDWGATAVDALTTAILMRQVDIVEVILRHVNDVGFTTTKEPISVFESTIRYIGGLLSAYELLKGPFESDVTPGMNIDGLLEQANTLGGVLAHAFEPGRALPSGWLSNDTYKGNDETGLAVAGTMVLEWAVLSELVGNATFAHLSQAAEEILMHPKFAAHESFRGLVGASVNITSNLFEPSTISWGGGSDSFYEYLIKMYVYDPGSFEEYGQRWTQAADSTMEHFASSPKARPDVMFIGNFDEKSSLFVPESGHMDCFAGGNYILGGTVLGKQKYIDFGLRITDGCHYPYAVTTTRIGPERWRWLPTACDQAGSRWQCSEPPREAEDFHARAGIWASEPSYNLRPEVIESYYYAWRATGDSKYREWAWEAWVAINATARLEHGFNYLVDVNLEDGGRLVADNQESYFFSETLKYLFMIFSEDAVWQVDAKGRNEWVFNTEGHPLRVRARKQTN